MRSLVTIAQFILGFIIGITLLAGSGVAAGYYFFTKLAATPARPIFAEERPKLPSSAKKPTSTPKGSSSPQASSRPSPKASPKPEPEKELPPGAYKARVTWSEGLILRAEPTLDAERIGGVAFNQELFVLKDSNDGRWQQVRAVEGELEGWVKAGNLERMSSSGN